MLRGERPPCCGPCQQRLGSCNEEFACCIECHFTFEEAMLFPHLPEQMAANLRAEHQFLADHGFPPHLMRVHTDKEEAWYRAYCPPDLVERVLTDHDAYESGEMPRRGPQ